MVVWPFSSFLAFVLESHPTSLWFFHSFFSHESYNAFWGGHYVKMSLSSKNTSRVLFLKIIHKDLIKFNVKKFFVYYFNFQLFWQSNFTTNLNEIVDDGLFKREQKNMNCRQGEEKLYLTKLIGAWKFPWTTRKVAAKRFQPQMPSMVSTKMCWLRVSLFAITKVTSKNDFFFILNLLCHSLCCRQQWFVLLLNF